jgi:hypothetical protein
MTINVRVKYKNLQIETEKAYLIDDIWFAKSLTQLQEKYIIIPEWLAIKKQLNYKPLFHIPDKIEPEYNQEALDELRY